MSMNRSSLKSTADPKINFSVIIPNHNGVDFLPDCISSLITAIKKYPRSNFEIILVDNASTDNSINLAQNTNFPNTKYLILDANK